MKGEIKYTWSYKFLNISYESKILPTTLGAGEDGRGGEENQQVAVHAPARCIRLGRTYPASPTVLVDAFK